MNQHRRSAFTLDRLSIDESPNVGVEAAELLLNRHEGLSVLNRGVDLQTIANDAGVAQKSCDLTLIVFRHLARIEIIKSGAIAIALPENYFPAQAGLRAFQNQKLEKPAVIVKRHAPLTIVIGNCQFSTRPLTAPDVTV